MKQMKRAVGLLLALVLVLSMAACGKKDGDGGDSQSGFHQHLRGHRLPAER